MLVTHGLLLHIYMLESTVHHNDYTVHSRYLIKLISLNIFFNEWSINRFDISC